jgi:hypothetical protein
MNQNKQLSSKEALLCSLRVLLDEQKTAIQYEDFIIQAHKRYPKLLCIKGYPSHPDSEVMSKRLYDLKRDGHIFIKKRFISLTAKGKAHADELLDKPAEFLRSPKKMGRDVKTEIERIKKTEVFHLYSRGRLTEIVDTDFFSYLGTTVKTDSTSFKGRLKTIDDVIAAAGKDKAIRQLVAMHEYLLERFKDTIKAMKGER